MRRYERDRSAATRRASRSANEGNGGGGQGRFRLGICLAVWLLAGIVAVAAPPGDSGKAKSKGKPPKAKEKPPAKIAVFRLRGTLTETPTSEDSGLFGEAAGTPLYRLVQRIDRAATDKNVAAVAFVLEGFSCGPAQAEELRAAMARVRRRGKPVYAHGDSLSMRDYVLACGANRISVVPTGDIQIMGLYGESLYLRGLFDLLGIEPDFTTCGDYKSAAEMFTRYGPSEPARRNREWLMDSLYDTIVAQIAQGRGVSETMVRRWIDEGLYTAERAEKAGVIDAVEHRQDFVSFLKKTHGEDVRLDLRYGKKAKKEVDFSSPFGLLKFYAELLAPKKERSSRSSIAIVYVDGPIVPGSSSGGFLFGPEQAAYSTPIRKALDRAAEDDSIKAVVLRIDSPGGSAVASEIILDATRRVKAKKPFVVSMGDVAGSGGYYVACAADTIYADRSTITASIGVVSGKLATKAMWRRFGVHFEATSRGRRAGMLLSSEPFTDGEKEQLQAWMNEVYEVFQGHVRASRGDRLKKDLAELAGGRVFTGAQAHKLGLVDRLGTLHDAIGYAAKLAKLEEGSYDVRVLPKPKSFFEVLFGEDLDEEKELELHMARPEKGSRLLEIWKRRDPAAARWLTGLQATDPARFAAVCEALRQVELFQSERVLLTMPSFLVW